MIFTVYWNFLGPGVRFLLKEYKILKKIQALFILLLLAILIRHPAAQTSSVPLSHWAYQAVERWEVQGFIQNAFTGTKPFSRLEMAEYLAEVYRVYLRSPEKFSRVDCDQLRYLQIEFKEEFQKLKISLSRENWSTRLCRIMQKQPLRLFNKFFYTNGRNLLALHHREFNLFADPIMNYSSEQIPNTESGKYREKRWSNGLLFRGNLGKYLGFYFSLTDNHLTDSRWKNEKIPFEVLQESGWPFLSKTGNGSFDFDENVAYLSFHYKYVYLLYGRGFNQWGIGHNGNLLLSTNAQPYDQIQLVLRYWRFKLTHLTGFLQYISPQARIKIKDQPHVDTYWAGNRLELDAGKGLQLGFSEAVVYGGRSLQVGYLNPLSFFKSLEHYYGDRDNGLIGLDFDWRIGAGIKIFGEWLIDDITTGKLGSNFYGNKFGWQGGFFLVNPLGLHDVDLLVEYSRIKPYVYSQSFQDFNKYKHYDTILGHFIGPNSDDLLLRARKWFTKFLQISAVYERYRHGSNPADRNVGGDPDLPWEWGDSREATFLDGILQVQSSWGVSAKYELFRNFFGEFQYRRLNYNHNDWQRLLSFRLSLNFGYRSESFRNIFPRTE